MNTNLRYETHFSLVYSSSSFSSVFTVNLYKKRIIYICNRINILIRNDFAIAKENEYFYIKKKQFALRFHCDKSGYSIYHTSCHTRSFHFYMRFWRASCANLMTKCTYWTTRKYGYEFHRQTLWYFKPFFLLLSQFWCEDYTQCLIKLFVNYKTMY